MEAAPDSELRQTCRALTASANGAVLASSHATRDDQMALAAVSTEDSKLHEPGQTVPTSALQDHQARGSANWWLRRGDNVAQPSQIHRELQGTCIFLRQQQPDGRSRRFVKKMGSAVGKDDNNDGPTDFDDTASWQSWRSLASHTGSLRMSRSNSEVSCRSTASGAAMQELLAKGASAVNSVGSQRRC